MSVAARPSTLESGSDLPTRQRGLAHARTLMRLFRGEQTDPASFYRYLAVDSAEAIARRYGTLAGRRVIDLGCGPGYYSAAFRAHGAWVAPIEFDPAELRLAGDPPAGAIVGDARRVPVESASVDGVFCSNMLEHAPQPDAVIDEMVRVLRPGGWGYLSWTNWYSPWGGHDISPYHYLGPERGLRAYEKRNGRPKKNVPGEGLFPTHIGPIVRSIRSRADVVVDAVEPRYWPWARVITKVPGVREVLTWNCVVYFHRR